MFYMIKYMVFTWLFGQSTIIATARVALNWSSSPNQCSKDARAHWSCSLDPIHAGMPECTGCTLNSAHLNDFLGTRCEPWQRRLLWLSPKTWALKWQDMFWLLESLHIPLNTNPFFFIDQSTALHCLINLLEVFFCDSSFHIPIWCLLFNNMQISCFTSAHRWQGETSCSVWMANKVCGGMDLSLKQNLCRLAWGHVYSCSFA